MLTIVTPASDLSLLTVPELRAAIGATTGSASEAALTALGDRVASVIARACRVATVGVAPATLRREALSETFRLKSRQDVLVLARCPVVEITTVTEDGTVLTADDDYEVDASAGLLTRISGDREVCWSSAKVVVDYTAGWETVPDDLKLAASKLAAVLWSEGERVDPNLKRESIPGVIDREWWVGPKDDPLIPAEVLDLLAPYRNHYGMG